MKDYKRWTKRNADGTYSIASNQLDEVIEKCNEQESKPLIEQIEGTQWLVDFLDKLVCAERNALLCCQKLGEIEDKIDNGTLVELPTTDKDILEDYAHKIFDSWNDITGAVNKNCSWYYEALWVIDDIVGMVWGITSRQYEAKLRELRGERE